MLNTFCWIHSTYTIPSAFWKRIGIDVAHPGIDKTVDPEERRYVRYYQWVCFCLFFQVSSVNINIIISTKALRSAGSGIKHSKICFGRSTNYLPVESVGAA